MADIATRASFLLRVDRPGRVGEEGGFHSNYSEFPELNNLNPNFTN